MIRRLAKAEESLGHQAPAFHISVTFFPQINRMYDGSLHHSFFCPITFHLPLISWSPDNKIHTRGVLISVGHRLGDLTLMRLTTYMVSSGLYKK